MEFPSAEQFKQNKVECGQILSWEEVPTEIIYCTEKVGQITTKSERVIMVVSLVDKDGISLKAFPASCLRNNLRDFSWAKNGSSNALVSGRDPDQNYYHYEIMRH